MTGDSPDKSTVPDGKPPAVTITPLMWAGVISIAIAAWMASGQLDSGSDAAGTGGEVSGIAGKAEPVKALFRVVAKVVNSEPRQAELRVRGETEADARVSVRAETAGVVELISEKKGRFVTAGTMLCTIETGARKATLLEAQAALSQARADYNSSRSLARKGHTGSLRVVANKARLDAAMAGLERASLDLARTAIKAPFAGVIEEESAKVGDYLREGDACAVVVRMDPMLLVGAVSESDIGGITLGQTVHGKLITGEAVEGRVSFISATADASTRTFRVEAEIANARRTVRGGLSADIIFPLKSVAAFRLSPSALTLDESGRIGVRIVDGEGMVAFRQVMVIANTANAAWVTGLTDGERVIVTGQEYVREGQKVEVVDSKPGSTRS